MIKVIKKDGTRCDWNAEKIKGAISKSYERYVSGAKEQNDKVIPFTETDKERVIKKVENSLKERDEVTVIELHELVMSALFEVNHKVYTEYRAYRNYKEKYSKSFANTYEFANKVVNYGDKENANKDSTLNSTKQALISEGIMKEFMSNFELKPEWIKAHNDGYIHIHDLGSRFINSHNCCLFDMENVLNNGFELNGIKYTEPGGVQSAFNVASDVVLSASAQQYGGFSVTNVDRIFKKYAIKTYNKALKYFLEQGIEEEKSKQLAENQTVREIEQGYQAFETKLNTVSNSLGQTPFVTISFGLDTDKWGQKISEIILKTRLQGLGEKKTTAVFPKLIFLHRDEICGHEGTPNYHLKKLGVECSSIMLYPDWLSIDCGYQKEVYEECGKTVTPMG